MSVTEKILEASPTVLAIIAMVVGGAIIELAAVAKSTRFALVGIVVLALAAFALGALVDPAWIR